MAGSISSSSYRGRFPWIFLMLLLQAACLTYDPSQPLDDATSIPPYKFQHIMEEIYPGASKVSMLSNVCVQYGGSGQDPNSPFKPRANIWSSNAIDVGERSDLILSDDSLIIIPALHHGVYPDAPHLYHPWQSFWPAIDYYIKHNHSIAFMLLPHEYIESTFMKPTIKGLQYYYPWLKFTGIPFMKIFCGIKKILSIDRDPDITGNGNWEELAPLPMNLGGLARKAWMIGCDLPESHVKTDIDVLFLERSNNTSGIHNRHFTHIDHLFERLTASGITYDIFVFQSDSTFCGQIRWIYKTYKVGISTHGQEILAFTMLPKNSLVLEVSPPCSLSYSFCDPLASANISNLQFLYTEESFHIYDMCNVSDDEWNKICASVNISNKYQNQDQVVLAPEFDESDIDRLIHAIKLGIGKK